MSQEFAKIVTASDGEQVLFYKDRDDDALPCVRIVTVVDGMTAVLCPGFPDTDEGWNNRDAAYDKWVDGTQMADQARRMIQGETA